MAKTKASKPVRRTSELSVRSNVVIGPRGQMLFVAVALLAWLVSTGMTVWLLTASAPVYAGVNFWLYQFGYVVFPLLLVAVAWWYVGLIGTVLNRLFKAVLITIAGMLVFNAAYSTVLPLLFSHWGANPGWWSDHGMEVILYGGFSVLYVGGLVGLKLWRKRG